MNSTTTFTQSIHLRRLSSSKYAPSEYTTTPSLNSTTASLLPAANASTFLTTNVLKIQAPGKSPISLPIPPKDLTTPIFSPTTGRPIYLSTRPKRGSGSCFLVDAEQDIDTSIANTTYKFGPGRSPRVKIGRDDDVTADVFEMLGKSLLTRTVIFESRKWGKFEWRYARKSERQAVAEGNEIGEINNLLVLERVTNAVAGDEEERVRVAQLIRGEGTRTPGTKSSYAGNGGRLEMCLRGEKGGELIDEVTVVVTCLVMLKKEIDRLRGVQIAAVGGGGA